MFVADFDFVRTRTNFRNVISSMENQLTSVVGFGLVSSVLVFC